MELLGAFFLVLAIGLTGNPIAIGSMLAVLVYLGGHISGAHYNPAVTIAVWIRGKIKKQLVLGYIISQLIGAFLAASILLFLTNTFIPQPSLDFSILQVILVEILFTFTLAYTVLTVATSKKLEGNHIYGIAIGLALMVGAFAAGPISGGVLNPAVALSTLILQLFLGATHFTNMIIYIIAPLIGGILAGLLFKYFNKEYL